MLNRDNDNELFDRYLRNQLTEAEKSEFDEFLLNDDAFNAAFNEYRTLVEGIRDYGRQALKAHLKAHTPKAPVRTFRIQRMAYAIAATLLIFLGIYAIISYRTPENAKQEIATSTTIQKENEPLADHDEVAPVETPGNGTPERTEKNENKALVEPAPPAVAERDVANAEDKGPEIATAAGAETEAMDDVESTYNILSDKKLSDTTLFAVVADEETVKFKDLAKNETMSTTKKALPSNNYGGYNNKADKVIEIDTAVKKAKTAEVKGEKYTVEFWQSPINFKGYKMTGTTIQLYGMNNPKIKLIGYNGKTYLRSGNVFYVLSACPDGCAYKTEQDETILNVLMNQ